MRSVVFHPAAAADVEEAWHWHEARRDGLGDEFLSVLQATLACIVAHPESAPVLHGNVRRQLLKRFPYGLFCRIVGGQVMVVACFHARLEPRVWRVRELY